MSKKYQQKIISKNIKKNLAKYINKIWTKISENIQKKNIWENRYQVSIGLLSLIHCLVMISIEKSETNKNEHWKSVTNLSQTMANAKSMAKIRYKFHGPRQIKKPCKSNW